MDLAIIKNDVQMVNILSPHTKNYRPAGILQNQEYQELSWKCFEILHQKSRKRKHQSSIHGQINKYARYDLK